jgi:cell division protein FtsI/penicillin-binding protein 2
MSKQKPKRDWKKIAGSESGVREPIRVRVFRVFMVAVMVVIVLRLFTLQIMQHGFYEALASGQHEIFQELFPERGSIIVQDYQGDSEYKVATNNLIGFVYADPRRVEEPEETAKQLAWILGIEMRTCEEGDQEDKESQEDSEDLESQEESEDEVCPSEYEIILERLSKSDDPYEPIMRGVEEEKLLALDEAALPGIYYIRESARHYPEEGMGGQVFGFVGSDDEGTMSGRYGVEGHFNEELSGTKGYLQSERDIAGRLIAVGDRSFEPAVDGANVVLTLDRAIQYTACSKIKETVLKHEADSGSVVILNPLNGEVIAMCAYPDYDPANYSDVETIDIFNNPVIFDAYEPGSIFKAITMAAAVDSGSVSPASTYEDTGEVSIDVYTIKNSDEEAHGVQTMTEVLEKSLNTGVIYAMREMGRDVFQEYVQDFGFGEYTGIELWSESPGDVSTLDEPSEIYPATASFGQGITATPLQMAVAFAAIANGGVLYEPHIVKEIRYDDGSIEETEPREIRQVISEKASQLVSAMLVSVVERGHGTQAGVDGYYVAGKTGTAQVPKTDGPGYEEDVTIGSFAGFAPASDPRFVMVVRVDRPRTVQWAESTAAPLFGELASFLLQYLEVPPERGN